MLSETEDPDTVQLTYSYRAPREDGGETQHMARQIVLDQPNLAMMIGRECRVRYLVATPWVARLDDPLLDGGEGRVEGPRRFAANWWGIAPWPGR